MTGLLLDFHWCTARLQCVSFWWHVAGPGLAGTELAQATVGSVRLKLLKVAAQVRVSVRRVYVQLSSAYPLQALFRLCHRRLRALVPASG